MNPAKLEEGMNPAKLYLQNNNDVLRNRFEVNPSNGPFGK